MCAVCVVAAAVKPIKTQKCASESVASGVVNRPESNNSLTTCICFGPNTTKAHTQYITNAMASVTTSVGGTPIQPVRLPGRRGSAYSEQASPASNVSKRRRKRSHRTRQPSMADKLADASKRQQAALRSRVKISKDTLLQMYKQIGNVDESKARRHALAVGGANKYYAKRGRMLPCTGYTTNMSHVKYKEVHHAAWPHTPPHTLTHSHSLTP